MAFTRAWLKGMGFTEEQVSALIEEHTSSTDSLKAQRDSYKADAEKLQAVQKELDELKSSGGDYQKKFDDEHAAFEAYKAEVAAKEARAAKETAYRALLESTGVGEKYIESVMRVADLDGITIGEDGKIADEKTVTDAIKSQYSDFITTKSTKGVTVENPPASVGGSTVTKEQFDKMSYARRLELYNNSPEVYNSLKGE